MLCLYWNCALPKLKFENCDVLINLSYNGNTLLLCDRSDQHFEISKNYVFTGGRGDVQSNFQQIKNICYLWGNVQSTFQTFKIKYCFCGGDPFDVSNVQNYLLF